MDNTFVARWVPPAIRHIVNKVVGAEITYKGPYSNWNQAALAADGYDGAQILARVAEATRRVLSGDADYEQDGVEMQGSPPPGHALPSLLLAAAIDHGRLSVLDFGGGLGSHYLRWRSWLSRIPNVTWCVVEQPHFVVAGQHLFSNISAVAFVESIVQARAYTPNAVIASSVLQYLPEPLTVLDELISLSPRLIVVDRTPFTRDNITHIMTQHVPSQIGTASYPLWAFGRESMHARLSERYSLLTEFPASDAPLKSGRVLGDYVGSVWLHKNR